MMWLTMDQKISKLYVFCFPIRNRTTRILLCNADGVSASPRALIKSFNGLSMASDARATWPHRNRIRHCDHYGIVGTSSPRDGRRWHCRYSVPGMQMAPRRMVICRLIRPASRPKTPRNYSHSRAERVCRTVRRKSRLGSYDNCLPRARGSDFKIFIPGEKTWAEKWLSAQVSLELSFVILLLGYLTTNWQDAKNLLPRKSQSESINEYSTTEKLLEKSIATYVKWI